MKHHPITEYRTIQERLRQDEEGFNQVGRKYAISTFDFGKCMQAYLLVWNDPFRYDKNILLIGTFQLNCCAYFYFIEEKMKSCGFFDVLLEAKLVKSATVHGLMSGKNYSRAMVCNKTMLETLERLLLFLETKQEKTVVDSLTEESKITLNHIIFTN